MANRSNGNLHRKHASYNEKRSVSCKQGEQAKVHQHAQYETGERNYKTYHTSGDADLLIVQKSVESASAVNTVLVGDYTDLLILLIYNASLDSCSLFLKQDPSKSTKKSRVWNIHAV